jgi:hypothetical protein
MLVGFKCDYFLSENVFRLTLKNSEEIKEDEEDVKEKRDPRISLFV